MTEVQKGVLLLTSGGYHSSDRKRILEVWSLNKGSCRSSQVCMEITANWYHTSRAEQVALCCTGDFLVHVIWSKENKFKTSISNNACCFQYSVYGNTSLQQEAKCFLIVQAKICKQTGLSKVDSIGGFFPWYHIYMVQLAATFPLLEKLLLRQVASNADPVERTRTEVRCMLFHLLISCRAKSKTVPLPCNTQLPTKARRYLSSGSTTLFSITIPTLPN